MPFNVTSSTLGVDLNNSSTTALFTLGQRVTGSDDSEWTYCIVTGTLTTGTFAVIQNAGTAVAPTTALLCLSTLGLSLGVIQTLAAQGSYAWMATRGKNLIFNCTGTVAPTQAAYYLCQDTAGALGVTATSGTLAGVYVTTSASTATLSTMARGVLTYPRPYNAANQPIS